MASRSIPNSMLGNVLPKYAMCFLFQNGLLNGNFFLVSFYGGPSIDPWSINPYKKLEWVLVDLNEVEFPNASDISFKSQQL